MTDFVRRWMIGALVMLLLAPMAWAKSQPADDPGQVYRIGFHIWKPGKIYTEAMQGIKDGLQLNGINYEAVEIHSYRDVNLAKKNLKNMDQMELDVIYSLSSAGTKLIKEQQLKTPVIATVINHPASLGISSEKKNSGGSITGTSYYVDAKKQLALYQTIFPKIKKVGMIFDGNNPAGYLAEEPFMREASRKGGAEFVSVPVIEKTELLKAAQQLVAEDVDIIVIPTNRLVYGNLETVLEVTDKHGIPLVSMNKQGVENGALAALYADTYNLGRQAANLASPIISQGKSPGEIGFEYIEEPDIILNLKVAGKLGVDVPSFVLDKATIVIQ
ncbi:ABC transporter substrate-binding protein [Dongshaea marina]|uniref:ABC transporter substrate-binding protein n=1 Tax=Dongshaea marina TaxID=2047966 RepID=UPI000D3E502F|nr:ABC transporter substrate-binding protein [Dongshaea marina]